MFQSLQSYIQHAVRPNLLPSRSKGCLGNAFCRIFDHLEADYNVEVMLLKLPENQKTIFFDSNEISKPNSVSELTSLDDNESYTPTVWPEQKKMDNIVRVLHKYLGLDLLGIDVVIDNRTGHYAIIDMNVFP
ncbi:hypothetical protein AVEN_131407-1, partial [Araneus ventricosus]